MTLCILLVLSFAIRLDAQFVYTAGRINGANKILGFTVTSTGALIPVPNSPFTAGSEPGEIVADPKGKYVYVVNFPTLTDGGNISGFRVSSNGELSAVPGSPFGRNYYGNPIVDVNGKFVFVTIISVTNDPNVPPAPDWIAAFRIGPSGSLEEVPGSPYITDVNSGPLVTDSTGQFLYIGIDDEEPSWAPLPPYIGGSKSSRTELLPVSRAGLSQRVTRATCLSRWFWIPAESICMSLTIYTLTPKAPSRFTKSLMTVH